MRLLPVCLAFVVGNVVEWIANYYPVLTIFFCIVCILKLTHQLRLGVVLLVLSFLIGFIHADIRNTDITETEALIGKRLVLTVFIENAEDKTLLRNVKVLSAYETESGNSIKLNKVNLILKHHVESYREYKVIGNTSKDSFYKNPSSIIGQNITLYIEQIQTTSPIKRSVLSDMRNNINTYISNHFQPESSGFIKAIITGERKDIDKKTRDAFNKTGLAHILSISGAHFGLFVFVVFKVSMLVLRFLPESLLLRLTLYLTIKQVSAILTIPFVTFYLLISSMSYPSIRAYIMILFFLIALLFHRRRYVFHSIVYAGFVIVLIDPSALKEISFILSFLAVCGIAVSISIQKEDSISGQNGQDKKKAIIKAIQNSILICMSATIATMPFSAYTFHYLSVISPISNLIFTPIIGFVILPIAIISSVILIITSYFPFNSLLDNLTLLIIKCIHFFADFECSSISIPSFPIVLLFLAYLLIAISIFWFYKNNTKLTINRVLLILFSLFIIITLLFKIPLRSADTLTVTFLDVGQGDSAVLELPDGKVMVIDTGKDGFQLSQFLKYRGIRSIHALVISHPQRDHVGGYERLISEFTVKEIWDNGYIQYLRDDNITKINLNRGVIIQGENYMIYVLHPHEGFTPIKNIENNLSLVLKVCARANSFLFTGDIEEEAIQDINHLGSYLNSTVLKIPHHGSKTTSDMNFFRLISPRYAVISAGRGNRHGLPHRELIELLEGIEVYRTDIHGAIRFREDRSGRLDVLTYKDFALKPSPNLKEEWSNLKRLFYQW